MTHFWIDLIERVGWTFIQAFLGALTASGWVDSVSAWESAAIAGVAAVFSLLKGVAAHRLEGRGTAQLVPFAGGTYSYSDFEGGH